MNYALTIVLALELSSEFKIACHYFMCLFASSALCFFVFYFIAKVLFRVQLPDGQVRDLHGSVDKERSHQNVLLVRTPSLSQYHFGNHPVQAQVVVITGRNQMPSNPLLFDFIPNRKCSILRAN